MASPGRWTVAVEAVYVLNRIAGAVVDAQGRQLAASSLIEHARETRVAGETRTRRTTRVVHNAKTVAVAKIRLLETRIS